MSASIPVQYMCCFAFSCTLLAERWPSCRRLRYSSWSSPGMINLGPFRSIPSSVDSSSLKSKYLLAKRGTCLLWCGQPCCVSWYTVARMGSLCVLSFSFSIHGFVKVIVVYSHVQFDFLWGSCRAVAEGVGQLHFLPWSILDGHIVFL